MKRFADIFQIFLEVCVIFTDFCPIFRKRIDFWEAVARPQCPLFTPSPCPRLSHKPFADDCNFDNIVQAASQWFRFHVVTVEESDSRKHRRTRQH